MQETLPSNFVQRTLSATTFDKQGRPTLTYPQLIALAILDSEQHQIPLNQIYKWIESHFNYYEHKGQWQGSVRYTLTTNKAFFRLEKQKNSKGSDWAIDKKMVYEIFFGRLPRRRSHKRKSLQHTPRNSRPHTPVYSPDITYGRVDSPMYYSSQVADMRS